MFVAGLHRGGGLVLKDVIVLCDPGMYFLGHFCLMSTIVSSFKSQVANIPQAINMHQSGKRKEIRSFYFYPMGATSSFLNR